MNPTEDLKRRWREASALVDQLDEERTKLLEPTEQRWLTALDALESLDRECNQFDHLRCDGCTAPIFDDDPSFGGNSILCERCSPTYQDLLDHPDGFIDDIGDPATPEQCRRWYDEHIAAGGSPSDSMARVER